jgi:hypothetical protein
MLQVKWAIDLAGAMIVEVGAQHQEEERVYTPIVWCSRAAEQ